MELVTCPMKLSSVSWSYDAVLGCPIGLSWLSYWTALAVLHCPLGLEGQDSQDCRILVHSVLGRAYLVTLLLRPT